MVTPGHCLMANFDATEYGNDNDKYGKIHGYSPVTEDSQYFSQGEMIGMKNDIAWIIKFFIYYISIKTLYYLQLVQQGSKVQTTLVD